MTDSVVHTLPLLDLLTHPTKEQGSWSDGMTSKVQSTYQLQPVDSVDSVSTKFTSTLTPPCASLFNWAIMYSLRAVFMCYIWHPCLFTPFPLAAFLPFFAHSTDLSCIAVTWQRYGGLEPGNWVFVQEGNTLTQTTHTVDSLPGTGDCIFPSPVITVGKPMFATLYDTSYLIGHMCLMCQTLYALQLKSVMMVTHCCHF